MFQGDIPVVGRQELPGDHARLTLYLPEIVARIQPGQLLAIRPSLSLVEPLLRRPAMIADVDATAGTISLVFQLPDQEPFGVQPGGTLDVLGPVGRGWTLPGNVRNILLIGTEQTAGALLFLANTALRRSCNVALLLGSGEGRPAFPAPLIPAAVEYQVARGSDPATAALELLDATLMRWADALYTTLPVGAYPGLAAHIRGTRMRWEPGFAQGLLLSPMTCFVGICDTCLVAEARRPWRACVDGPQCDVRDFVGKD